jgi:replicative DNA helicase
MIENADLHEKRVLGAALGEPGFWLAHAAQLTPDLFRYHRGLATQICEMTALGRDTDPQSVIAWMTDRGISCQASFLLEVQDAAPFSAASMELSVAALHDAAKRYGLRQLAQDILAQTENPAITTADIMTASHLRLADVGTTGAAGVEHLGSQVLRRVMAGISKPKPTGIKTGIAPLDLMTSGFQPGQLVILGARPSMGKTALAIGWLRQAAMAGKSCVYISLEMGADEVCERLLASLSGVMLARITNHRLSSNDLTVLHNAAARASDFAVWVGESANQIEPILRQIKHREGLDFCVIDYLQLMTAGKGESREQRVAGLSRRLKQLARALGIPILVLAQLNRQVEQRTHKRPNKADLRESGAIEQDADIVMLLWREHYYDQTADPEGAELIIDKHRNGPTGDVPLRWLAESTRFVYGDSQ